MNYVAVKGSDDTHDVIIYALSTCPHCTDAKKFLKEHEISYRYIDVDKATRDEKREVTMFLKSHDIPIVFPVIVVDDNILVGFDESAVEEMLK